MSGGEIFIAIFVLGVFGFMIYILRRLYRWNKKDMAAKAAKNEAARQSIFDKETQN